MKLYYSPGACSLADHIALHEAGLAFDLVRVDLKTRKTADGADYMAINSKGYVPALMLDDGDVVTENIAILDWISHRAPALAPEGVLAHTRLLSMLAFISTELHKSFAPFFKGSDDAAKEAAAQTLAKRFGWIAGEMRGNWLFGDRFTVADAYLFVMLTWAEKFDLAVPDTLATYRERVRQRDAVRTAMTHEGLI